MRFQPTDRARRRLRSAALIALATLVVAGLLFYLDYRSDRRAWRRAIRDPDRAARVDAWTRLQRDGLIRGLDRDATAREVFALLDDPDPETRLSAIAAVASINAEPTSAIARLAGRLDDPEPEVRAHASSTIGDAFRRGGGGRDEALRAIARALKDPVAVVRSAALSSLGRVVYEGGQAVDPLRSSRSEDPALEMARDRLGDVDPAVRVEAAFVLGCNDRGGEAVPMLVAYLRAQPPDQPPTHSADRAFLAVMVLAVNSDEAAAFLANEISQAREGYPDRPRDALAWAARQSPEARLRVKRLATTLLDPSHPSTRHNAGLLLHAIGSDQPAIPVLIETLADPSVDLRVAAVEALAEIGGTDPAIFAALETASNDLNREVRERASAALEALEWAEILSGLEGANP